MKLKGVLQTDECMDQVERSLVRRSLKRLIGSMIDSVLVNYNHGVVYFISESKGAADKPT
jgi:hypothetical protein